ncbi:TrkH family potassium uptake protein [Paraclostridium bifermentans]|uniref:TrkH family potassium uptake protein n=1 Tax=Paraclostridium bifermentans TaxID=1490 RepID=UPI00359C4B50
MKEFISSIKKPVSRLNPSQIMVIGFATVILIGAILLSLPIATQTGERIPFLDALFTSTSAVCVTGLVVVDTATYWSTFGQVVIILLIQVGGLGFMTISTLFALITKKRINLKERLLIQESLNQIDLSGLVKLSRYVLLMTFTIEGIGALILSTVFIPEFGIIKGIWYSIFHAISAFCNAGFDLMGTVSGPFTSLTKYVNNVTISITISGLIILGGIGFPVILDVVKNKKPSKFNIHTKVVLVSTAVLILVGMIFILAVEYTNPKTLGSLSLKGKLLSSFFQSVTTRTAGFNTIDLTLLHQGSLFVMILLMFIGAAPCSTGGGIKVTTLSTIILSVRSFLFGKEDIEVFERRVSLSTVRKSIGVFFIGMAAVLIGIVMISLTENSFDLIESAFEVVSAFATVGLSIGGSPNLTIVGKILIMLYMFMGRVGLLTIFLALMSKNSGKKQVIRYPEGKIIVG